MERLKVLSTKILPAALKEKAENYSISLTQKDFISIEPVADRITVQKILHQFKISSHFIFTSANGVEAVAKILKSNQIFIKNKIFYCL